MKIKIVSDGTSANTKVLTEKGEEIKGITEIKWRMNADESISEAKITFLWVPVKLIGEVKRIKEAK